MIESVTCEVCGAQPFLRVSPPYLCPLCRDVAAHGGDLDDDDYPVGQVQG